MKSKLYRSFALVIVIVSFTAGLAAAANPSTSAPDNVPRFLSQIEKAGFSYQEGLFTYYDLIKHVCEDGYFSAMGNNPWPNAYFVLQMPNPPEVKYELPYHLGVADETGRGHGAHRTNTSHCQVFRYSELGEYGAGFATRRRGYR